MKLPFSALKSVFSYRSPVIGRFREVVLLAGLIFLLFPGQQPNPAYGQQLATVNPYLVEAAFLRNFAHYVTWPPHAFDEADTPWSICILGPNPFRDFLDHTFEGRMEKGRPFEIVHVESLDELPQCHIVFITFQNPEKRRAVLRDLKDKPVLTVSEAPDFLKEGGIIQFRVSDRVSMSVNLDQADLVALNIQTKMLEVSERVIENGQVRTMR